MQRLACEVKLKATSGAGVMSFEGYGAVFGNVDSYGDVIAPGAFASFLADVKSGKQPWPMMLSQHGAMGLTAEDQTPIGIWTSLAEDGTGLKVSGALADTQRGRDLHTLMKMEPRPAIDGLSIGFIPKAWTPRSKPEDPRRTLTAVDLIEISPVTFPANRLARVSGVKSIEELARLSEIEDYLREARGFTRNEAKCLIARIKASGTRDASSDLGQLTAALKRNIQSIQA